MSPHKKDHRRSLKSWYVWHRWVGIACALLVIWLAITGILLNHADRLGLNRHSLHSPWLLRAYGIKPQPPEKGFPVRDHWVTQAGNWLFLDGRPVIMLETPLVGIANPPGIIVAATQDALLLMTIDGEWVETIGREGLPGPVQAIVQDGPRLLIRTPDAVFATDSELLEFVRHVGHWPAPLQPHPLPAGIAQAITAQGAGIGMNGERVLADLHSGRLFGRFGPLVMDLASLGFIFLSVTGLWLWWRYRQSQQDRMRHRHH